MRKRFLGCLAILACLVLLPAAGLFAADEHKDNKHKTSKFDVTTHIKGKHEEKVVDLSKESERDAIRDLLLEGQLVELKPHKDVNLLDIAFDLGLWTIVVFLLLYYILKTKAWGPILEGLQKREQNIHAALDAAKKAQEDAQILRAQLQKEMDNAAQKIREMMDEARRGGQQLKDEMKAETMKEIQADRDRLLREIKTAGDQELQRLFQKSVELATLLSAKTIRRQLSNDDHRRLLDEALVEMKAAGTDGRSLV
jgi:F-type H+-transporting ATPase subunit b